jgi:predicted dehydrogenase
VGAAHFRRGRHGRQCRALGSTRKGSGEIALGAGLPRRRPERAFLNGRGRIMREHRIGLIGAGEVVKRFILPALDGIEGASVVAIASAGGVSATDLARDTGIPTVCASYDALLELDGVETIFVCTPPDTHLEIAGRALDLGKNVLVEKPVCAVAEDSQRLFHRARQGPGVCGFTFNNLYREENQAVIGRVLAGEIGELEWIELAWLRRKHVPDKPWMKDPAKAGGGVLADLGSHLLAIGLHLIAHRRSFSAECHLIRRDPSRSPVEDVAIAHVILNGSIPVLLRAGWGMPMDDPVRVEIRAHGRQGTAANTDYQGQRYDGYRTLIRRFFQAIVECRQPDNRAFEDTMKILHALYKAACSGETVRGTLDGGDESDT